MFEYSGRGAFVPHQNLIQLFGSNERILGNTPEQIVHRSHIKVIKLSRSQKTLNHMQVSR